jgi:hypothetical protein
MTICRRPCVVQQCLGCDARVSVFNVGDNTGWEVKLQSIVGHVNFLLYSKQVYVRLKQERQNGQFTLVMLTVGKEIPNK